MDERPLCECHGEPMYWAKDSKMRAGGRWRCVIRKRERARQWRVANSERVREYNRRYFPAWYERNSDKRRDYFRDWYGRNADRVRAAARQWYEQNRERAYAQNRRWREENLEVARAIGRLSAARRYARLRSVLTVPFSRDQLMCRMAYWGNRCWVCGGAFEEVDHVIALARGGPHCLANLRPICRTCNRRKRADDWREWVERAS